MLGSGEFKVERKLLVDIAVPTEPKHIYRSIVIGQTQRGIIPHVGCGIEIIRRCSNSRRSQSLRDDWTLRHVRYCDDFMYDGQVDVTRLKFAASDKRLVASLIQAQRRRKKYYVKTQLTKEFRRSCDMGPGGAFPALTSRIRSQRRLLTAICRNSARHD